MIQGIFDTHAHYDDKAFDPDRAETLERVHSQGVSHIVTCACDIPTMEQARVLSEQFDFVWFAAGFHPEMARNSTLQDLNAVQAMFSHPKCVAVGEIGLEYHWKDCCPKELQLERFEQQIQMALEADLPVIVHDREAHQDVFDLLKRYKPKGVVHCYSGSQELMREIVKLGLYIGMGGVVTFKNARRSLEVAAAVPLDRLLLETDAPYLAPVPHRGKRCDSAMIAYTAEAIAALRGMEPQELVAQCRENGLRLFQIL